MINIGILDTFKKKKETTSDPLYTGRVSAGGTDLSITHYRSRSRDLLKDLRNIHDEADAIEFISKKTPDGSMALWNFTRYANQGHQMKFYPIGDKEREISIRELEDDWREFASRINAISNSGLDGLIDIFHKYGVLYGNQMCEVEINKDRTDIVEVHPIDPRSIMWEWGTRKGRKVPIPYQYNEYGDKVDLSKGNVFYVPLDPDGNDPSGTLIMAPALPSTDSQLQVSNDVHAVLHHQGYGRDFYSIDLERVLNMCPSGVKNNPVELKKWLDRHHASIVNALQNIEPDSDIVTYDDVTRSTSGSSVTRSVDFRAINEMTDVGVLNGLKQLSTFANRHSGRTETYSSVEMKIFVNGILSLQRGSKRLIEEIARLWLRVKGVQAVPVFTHNVVDWQSEIQKEEVATSKLNRYSIAVLMGFIDEDTAARETMGVKNAVGRPSENVKVTFSSGGVNGEDNDKHSGEIGSKREVPGEDAF